MATYQALTAVCQATIYLLQSSYEANMVSEFTSELEFAVYTPDNFLSPMDAGVSLFLYRVIPNNSHRTPPGRIAPNGQRYHPQLPLDLHFLLTAWGRSASLQQSIVGWMMRVLEDTPIMPVGLLNRVMPGVFNPSETVELTLGELSTDDLFHLWEILPQQRYQLSIPYTARNVRIESTELPGVGEPVQERIINYQQVENG
ncbi:MAG: DUF4255 domain-containing protein [Ardenticatenaceae bacterium]|nr:DUF4255 domain-containing protein [Ardenticatenaceae bacterium]